MTAATKAAIREILTSIRSASIAFVYQKDRKTPEYSVDRALAEIVEFVEAEKAIGENT